LDLVKKSGKKEINFTTDSHVPHCFYKNMNDGMSQSDRTTLNYQKKKGKPNFS